VLDSVVYGTYTPIPSIFPVLLFLALPPLFTISGKIRQVH
jgi:hypothetical protein